MKGSGNWDKTLEIQGRNAFTKKIDQQKFEIVKSLKKGGYRQKKENKYIVKELKKENIRILENKGENSQIINDRLGFS